MRSFALALTVACCFIVGCGKEPAQEGRMATRAARIEKANAEVGKPVVPRVQQIGGNEIVTVELPSADRFGYIETQRCFVWRDLEMRTASISCPQPPELALPK